MGIVFIVLVIAAVYYFTKSGGGINFEKKAGQSSLDILNERYARGEIDEEEYEKKKRILTEA
ncbi:SHOCT domain-containing protein [Bacillus marinisedimentorum]|uniref:SHOCT domain-containing protein n=1 Tax=Bacillus marinisedimentorum TaxID=1821260 RepID=UPI0007DF036C|nr:SHOCT domain-containing protein [Bacillus marinisedimentorum]